MKILREINADECVAIQVANQNAKEGNGQSRKSGYTKDTKLAVNWRTFINMRIFVALSRRLSHLRCNAISKSFVTT